MNRKISTLEKLKTAEAVYVLLSRITNLPYVECDPETYDDQIFLFYSEENARKGADRFLKEKAPLQIIKVEKKSFLMFYTSLYPMGVNCIVVDDGAPMRIAIQLEELVRRVSPDQLPKGQILVENPQFHLTAIYFVQEIRKNPGQEMTEELRSLYEEMLVHFGRGKFLFAADKDQSVLMVRGEGGKEYQLLFTDSHEFQKFDREKKFQARAVDAEELIGFLPPECDGVVINPVSLKVQLQLAKRNSD